MTPSRTLLALSLALGLDASRALSLLDVRAAVSTNDALQRLGLARFLRLHKTTPVQANLQRTECLTLPDFTDADVTWHEMGLAKTVCVPPGIPLFNAAPSAAAATAPRVVRQVNLTPPGTSRAMRKLAKKPVPEVPRKGWIETQERYHERLSEGRQQG